jgi:secreted trypsin-like serine protease
VRPRPVLSLTLLALALLAALPTLASAQTMERIKNGDPVASGTYEWTVALVFDGSFANSGQFCGGTLVDPTTVVTAAHCVAGSQPGAPAPDANENGIEVVANFRNLDAASNPTDPDIDSYYIDVAEIHVISTSDGVDPDSDELAPRDDVAVLELASAVDTPTTIPPITPQGGADDNLWDPGDDLEVSGWGRMEDDTYPVVMRHATVDRLSDTTCTNQYDLDGLPGGASLFSSSDMLCALRGTQPDPDLPDPVVDACDGDSGGPLTTFAADASAANGRKLVGIVSWGSFDCDDPNEGGVYTRVGAPDINAFIQEFLDANEGDDPAAQLTWVSGLPTISGTQQAGETVTCERSGDETFTRTPDEYDLRLRAFFEEEGWVTLSRTGFDTALPGAIQYELTNDEVGTVLACDLYARETGPTDDGGYAVASFFDETGETVVEPAAGPGPDPDPDPEPDVIVVPPTVPPVTPPENPPVVVPRDEGLPRTTRVTRRCNRRTQRCSLRIFATDTTTAGAFPSGVAALEVRLTTRYRCVRRGRARTCVSRRTLPAEKTLIAGRFKVTTPRLRRRGLHTLRINAVDANLNREPRALTYSFRLPRRR